MFMDNKALLDQLMGKDRNTSTFQGLREQWKDSSMCRSYLLDFCPHELFNNTRMSIGVCSRTHSDVVKQQYEASTDPEKSGWTRKTVLDLLSQLERIIDTIEQKIRRQRERVNANVPEYRLSIEKAEKLKELNLQISLGMKQVEKLAESGQFDESTLLMAKVTELSNQARDISEDKYSQVVKKEVVCAVCGVLTGAGVDEDGRPERPHDHIRGKQHSGMELVRLKVIEIKDKFKLSKSARDKSFEPSEEILRQQKELRGEELHEKKIIPVDDAHIDLKDDTREVKRGREKVDAHSRRDFKREYRKTRSRSPRRDTDEFGRRIRPTRSRSVSSVSSGKSMISVSPLV